MRTRNRKRTVLVTTRGAVLVLIALILQAGGYLSPVESLLYDERVRHCQGYQPQPAESLVHLDVDDNTLSVIGHWPWPPFRLARIVDEIARTKPKVLTMDVLFLDPAEKSSEDQTLADAFQRLGCGTIPFSLTLEAAKPPSGLHRKLLALIEANPELTRAQCLAKLGAAVSDDDLDADPTDTFLKVRETAIYERIWQELSRADGPAAGQDSLKSKLFPHLDPLLTGAELLHVFDDQYDRVVREQNTMRFALPVSATVDAPLLSAHEEKAPVLPLGDVAADSGFVDDLPETVEGTVRTVPLLARFRGRVFPQMGLATACAELGIDVRGVRLTDTALTIPRPGGAPPIVVPVSVRDSSIVGSVGALMDVPMFGRPRDWKTMYDVPNHVKPARQISALEVWQICETLDKLSANEASTDRMLIDAMSLTNPEGAKAYEAKPLVGGAKHQLITDTLAVLDSYITNNFGTPVEIGEMKKYRMLLPPLADQTAKIETQLVELRASLLSKLHGKAIFFGGTATSLSDLRPTSLFGSTPGVMVHGAVFNAILTGKMWKRVNPWVGYCITAGIGLAMLLLVMNLGPGAAFAGAAVLGVGYLAVNGYLLFARDNLIIDAAGPTLAVALVWAGMTLTNYLTEIADRARITRRFRSYVDPAVVDYYVLHPDHKGFDGERRELTIGFSDLAGFTTLTDQLGERVVPLLAEYMSYMVPVIRGYRGTFDKQIGDGICFFFGAPIPDDQHARRAVETALAMHKSLAEFNQTLAARGLQTLGMRIGLATGDVIVGDAGAANAASYTTLGATTNLASRLEGANKSFGTHTLVTARTIDLIGGAYLTRPIANIQVAGKLDCVVVHEPICLAAEATHRDRELARLTAEVFNTYRDADFVGCLRATAALEAAFGPSKLAAFYAKRAAHPPDIAGHCGGQIVMTDK